MLNQSVATNVLAEDLKAQLYASVGLQERYKDLIPFLDRNFSPYNFILGFNPYVRNAKNGQIGNIRDVDIFQYTSSNVIDSLCLDLDVLDYEYRILDAFFSDTSLYKKEFLLKLFICEADEENKRGDYQIMRYDSKIKEWFFKPDSSEAPILCKNASGVIMICGAPAMYVRADDKGQKHFRSIAYVAVRPMRLSKKLRRFFRRKKNGYTK